MVLAVKIEEPVAPWACLSDDLELGDARQAVAPRPSEVGALRTLSRALSAAPCAESRRQVLVLARSTSFFELAPRIRRQALDVLGLADHDGSAIAIVARLVDNAAFRALHERVQSVLFTALRRDGTRPALRDVLIALAECAGFYFLEDHEQIELLEYLHAPQAAEEYGELLEEAWDRRRSELSSMVQFEAAANSSEDQADLLRDFLHAPNRSPKLLLSVGWHGSPARVTRLEEKEILDSIFAA